MKARAVETVPDKRAAVDQDLQAIQDAVTWSEPADKVRMRPVLLTVQRQYKKSGQLVTEPEETSEELTVQGFHVEPAVASLRVNHTVNLGNFASLSVQVGMEVPCHREEYAEAMKTASETVAHYLEVEIEKGKERAIKLRGQHQPQSGSSRSTGGGHPF